MPTDVDVDQYAAGDGKTDDTLAIRKALATGLHLRFTRGKTYVYSGQLVLQPAQIVFGNGATLKRRAQVQTTTNSSVTAGQTKQIDVADASGLAVGMDITLKAGSNYDPNNRTITAINGNTVTVSSAFGINSSGAANVYSLSHGLYLLDDCRVYDLIMDGNRSNFSFATWENSHEMHMRGVRSQASGCYLQELPATGFYLERDYITVTDCTLLNCNGNGVHLSYSNKGLINRCRVQNANLDASLGLNDGCVVLGNSVDQLTVTGCYLENGTSGVGSWNATDNSNLSIVGNIIVGCRNSALAGASSGTSAPGNVLIENNRIYDSGVLYVKGVGGSRTTVFPSHVTVAGNYLRNTKVDVGRARYIEVTDNIIDDSGNGATEIAVSDSKHVLVRGNAVNGGNIGVSVSGGSENVLIQGNSLSGQAQGAVAMQTVGLVNCQAVNNHVTGDSSAASTYRGITVLGKEAARGNLINIASGDSGIYADSQAIVKDNVVRSGSATYSIRAAPSSSGVLIKDNEVTSPVSNGGTGNVETGTVLIP